MIDDEALYPIEDKGDEGRQYRQHYVAELERAVSQFSPRPSNWVVMTSRLLDDVFGGVPLHYFAPADVFDAAAAPVREALTVSFTDRCRLRLASAVTLFRLLQEIGSLLMGGQLSSTAEAPVRLLFVGCGTGYLTLLVRQLLRLLAPARPVQLLAWDPTPALVATARAAARRLAVVDDVLFQTRDADWPLHEASPLRGHFDLVVVERNTPVEAAARPYYPLLRSSGGNLFLPVNGTLRRVHYEANDQASSTCQSELFPVAGQFLDAPPPSPPLLVNQQLAAYAVERGNWLLAARGLLDDGVTVDVATAKLELRDTDDPVAAAADAFAEALSRDADSAAAHAGQSIAHCQLGRAQQALDAAQHCLRLQPASHRGHLLAARALLRLGRHADAQQHAATAARLAPDNSTVRRLVTEIEQQHTASPVHAAADLFSQSSPVNWPYAMYSTWSQHAMPPPGWPAYSYPQYPSPSQQYLSHSFPSSPTLQPYGSTQPTTTTSFAPFGSTQPPTFGQPFTASAPADSRYSPLTPASPQPFQTSAPYSMSAATYSPLTPPASPLLGVPLMQPSQLMHNMTQALHHVAAPFTAAARRYVDEAGQPPQRVRSLIERSEPSPLALEVVELCRMPLHAPPVINTEALQAQPVAFHSVRGRLRSFAAPQSGHVPIDRADPALWSHACAPLTLAAAGLHRISPTTAGCFICSFRAVHLPADYDPLAAHAAHAPAEQCPFVRRYDDFDELADWLRDRDRFGLERGVAAVRADFERLTAARSSNVAAFERLRRTVELLLTDVLCSVAEECGVRELVERINAHLLELECDAVVATGAETLAWLNRTIGTERMEAAGQRLFQQMRAVGYPRFLRVPRFADFKARAEASWHVYCALTNNYNRLFAPPMQPVDIAIAVPTHGHPLTQCSGSNYTCDLRRACKTGQSLGRRFRCAPCNYDECEHCIRAHFDTSNGAPEVPPDFRIPPLPSGQQPSSTAQIVHTTASPSSSSSSWQVVATQEPRTAMATHSSTPVKMHEPMTSQSTPVKMHEPMTSQSTPVTMHEPLTSQSTPVKIPVTQSYALFTTVKPHEAAASRSNDADAQEPATRSVLKANEHVVVSVERYESIGGGQLTSSSGGKPQSTSGDWLPGYEDTDLSSGGDYSALEAGRPVVELQARAPRVVGSELLAALPEISPLDLQLEPAPIGSGIGGVVRRGMWRGGLVAVKFIKTVPFEEEDMRQKFVLECSLLAKTSHHSHVVKFVGCCTTLPNLMLVSQYCENGSVHDWLIRKNSPCDLPTLVRIMKETAAGLLHLHAENVVHRDIAARNVLLDARLSVYVTDFGMARVKETCRNYGTTYATLGPVKWMAPECFSEKKYSFATDVWAFAVYLYELLARREPYGSLDLLDVAVGLKTRTLKPSVPDGTHPVVAEIMQQAWSYEPHERPSMQEIFTRLHQLGPTLSA